MNVRLKEQYQLELTWSHVAWQYSPPGEAADRSKSTHNLSVGRTCFTRSANSAFSSRRTCSWRWSTVKTQIRAGTQVGSGSTRKRKLVTGKIATQGSSQLHSPKALRQYSQVVKGISSPYLGHMRHHLLETTRSKPPWAPHFTSSSRSTTYTSLLLINEGSIRHKHWTRRKGRSTPTL